MVLPVKLLPVKLNSTLLFYDARDGDDVYDDVFYGGDDDDVLLVYHIHLQFQILSSFLLEDKQI